MGLSLRLLKKITNFGGTHTYKHFYEFRAGHGKEWDIQARQRLWQALFYRYLEGLQEGERLSAWRLPRLCISLSYEGNLQSLQGFPWLHPLRLHLRNGFLHWTERKPWHCFFSHAKCHGVFASSLFHQLLCHIISKNYENDQW